KATGKKRSGDRHNATTRERRRPEQHKRAQKRNSEPCPCRSAEYPKDEAFCEQLRDQLAPTRAEGGPHGNLPTTSLPSRKQQIRDVRTGDEKYERDAAAKNNQRGAYVANNRLAQR